ncbi:MAG: alpha-L-fucosidase [Verrucomicrobiota bacterium]
MSTETTNERGAQRLSLEQLQKWEALKYGMFIHYGMSTYTGAELDDGSHPSTLYAPDKLDVDQWISVARDAGMKYAVLTTKHVAGHCLWPTKHNDYHVGTSSNKTDVVEAFVNACEKRGVLPGFYYCSWDNHNRFGSRTYSDMSNDKNPGNLHAFTTREYQDFQTAQLEELLTSYGKVAEVWIDIPSMLPRCYREDLYRNIATWQPEAVIMNNNGIGDGSNYPVVGVNGIPCVGLDAWPADIIAIERFLPNSHTGHVKWREIEGKKYYMPGEVCDPIGREWFFTEEDQPRSDEELLGMYLVSISRGTNLLLDVGPDKHGLIPQKYIGALQRLRANLDRLGMD